jgi:DedD protein
MIRDFSKEELEPVAANNHVEFTLGGGTLLTLAGGLLILCVVCFVFGYAVGHRGTADRMEATVVSSPLAKMPTGTGTKPGAAAVAPPPAQALEKSDQAEDESKGSSTSSETSASSSAQTQALNPQVRPALSAQGNVPQPGGTLKIQPATTQSQGWMVQIAAISHAEDAQVLVDALKKRGYEVTVRRDVGDNLIHVQTGPFSTRNDANAMRQKLLNDGYNAMVQ